jgi:hypothetical protein
VETVKRRAVGKGEERAEADFSRRHQTFGTGPTSAAYSTIFQYASLRMTLPSRNV